MSFETRCEFRGVGQWRRPGERDSAGGRQRVPRNLLCQWRERLPWRGAITTSNLKAQGLASPTGFDRLVDESAGFGGPILKDRLWFYYAERYRDNDSSTGVDFYSINPLHTTYNPNLSKPLHRVALTMTTRFA